MLYKIIGTNFYMTNILDMLRYCNGTLKIIKTNKKINEKLVHHINYKPCFKDDGQVCYRNYKDMLTKNNLWKLNDNTIIIKYIIVESDNISIKRWNSFGYKVQLL